MEDNKNTENLTPVENVESEQDKAIRDAVEKTATKIRNDALTQGAKMICGVIMQMINKHIGKKAKPSLRDYERLTKDVYNFIIVPLNQSSSDDPSNKEGGAE